MAALLCQRTVSRKCFRFVRYFMATGRKVKMRYMNTRQFIEENKLGDVRMLALTASKHPSVNMPFALDQIAGWQTARKKLPKWSMKPLIIYPQHLSMEQCSSEFTAMYKASVVAEKIESGVMTDGSMTDITGGFGVDFSFLAEKFRRAVYVERQKRLCSIARHNFRQLELGHAEVVCGNGDDYIFSMKPQDFVYIDPARRNDRGGRTYAIEDCTPNVAELNSQLLKVASVAMIKLSPMLDWHKAVAALTGVTEVHIVSAGNECKELLLLLRGNIASDSPLTIVCVNDCQRFSYTLAEADHAAETIAAPLSQTGNTLSQTGIIQHTDPAEYIFEPNASIMKAGSFALLCQRYGVRKVAANSNLFVSSDETVDFPGRRFAIEAVTDMKKRNLREFLHGLEKANIAVRNFPLTAAELRKRLKLADGGDVYVFGTTDSAKRHILLRCRKL